MKPRYEKAMRERAKAEKKGLFTIGCERSNGASWYLQGPATDSITKRIFALMEKLIATPGRASSLGPRRSKP